jgi:hypothetical protein
MLSGGFEGFLEAVVDAGVTGGQIVWQNVHSILEV